MSGIHPAAMLAVCQILVNFRDDIGNPRSICGTGFWIQDGGDSYFVTNRHNVDARLKFGPATTLRPEGIQLQLRARQEPDQWLPNTVFVALEHFQSSLRCHATADVAILKNPSLPSTDSRLGLIGHSTFNLTELATAEFLADSVQPMDFASFIGFPGNSGKPWWDQRWNFPISRTVNVSSWPRYPFSNDSIITPDVVLVSGLSFSGSSGSPVISHEKGQRGFSFGDRGYVDSRILGIMSGHHSETEPETGMLFHSGLSYFTRATSIRELLVA